MKAKKDMKQLKVFLSASRRLSVLEATSQLYLFRQECIRFKPLPATAWMGSSNFCLINRICVLFCSGDILCLYLCLCSILMEYHEDIVGWMLLIKILTDIIVLRILRSNLHASQLKNYVSSIPRIKNCSCIWICMLILLTKEISSLATPSMNLYSKLKASCFLKCYLRTA